MGKPSAVDRLIAELKFQKLDLERQVALLGDMIDRLQQQAPKPKRPRVVTPEAVA